VPISDESTLSRIASSSLCGRLGDDCPVAKGRAPGGANRSVPDTCSTPPWRAVPSEVRCFALLVSRSVARLS
jgi:hypothetical protein